jgi:flagella basal body P-ring formation protein FlgA
MTHQLQTARMLLPVLAVLTAFSGHCEEPRAVVTLHAEALTAGPEVMLREVADFQATPAVLARLTLVSLSSAPMAGSSRVIEAGYICLRLRRLGLGTAQVEVRGERVTVRRPTAVQSAVATPQGTVPAQPAVEPPTLVRRGQLVEVEAECGAVTIRASATASRDAAEGELVELRLPDSARRVVGRVVGPGRVSLIITEIPS